MSHYDDAGSSRRWDRDTFERERFSRRAEPEEREYTRFDERDRYGPGPGRPRRELEVEIREERRDDRRGPAPVRERERERVFEEDRFERRRPAFLDEPSGSEVASRALAPYRRRADLERELDPLPVRRPPRPQFIRRQSSLDTFDRRPMPRYGDEYRIPPEVPVPLPIRRPASPPRRYREREIVEEVYKGDHERLDEYDDVRVKRDRSRRGSRAATSVRDPSSDSSSSFERVEKASVARSTKQDRGRKGKTRMPKRLAEKKAIIDLGYTFEEEEDFIIIHRALTKEHIDEIIEVSKKIKSEETSKFL